MVTILYTLIIHRASAYSHYALYSYYQQRVRIWSLCSIFLLSTEGAHMVTMLHALIIHRGSTYGHYTLYSSYPQRVGIWSLCSMLLLSTEGPYVVSMLFLSTECRHMVTILYTLIINRRFAYGYYALYSYYPQKVGI
jgi:hypothetical protein